MSFNDSKSTQGHDARPLPHGWIEQFDESHQRYFWVDTSANPPRSIWTHPLDDPVYQKSQHSSGYAPPSGPPPAHPHESSSFPSDDRLKSSHSPAPSQSPYPPQSSTLQHSSGKKGIFGKLKDKLDSKQSRPAQQYGGQAYGQQGGYGRPQPEYMGQPMYGQQGYPQRQQGRFGGGGGGGMNPALMLGGGLLGGALLGGALADSNNGDYQDGYQDGQDGDFGGGDDMGGDF
ncbi:hypothetical protein JCM1841_001700 [Sporobolomyces salmonicolor]